MSDHRRRPRLPAAPSGRAARRPAAFAALLLTVSLTAALNGGPAQADSSPALDTAVTQTGSSADLNPAVTQAGSSTDANPAASQAGSPSAAPDSLASTDPRTVTTLTGGKILVRADGTQVRQDGGPALSYTGAGGDRYVVPAEAAPYAGRSLDWTLFDVSALVRDHLTDGARIPVALSFSSAGATPPPGITLTSSGTGISATGYLTPSSAKDFAGYLRDRIAADVAAGKPAGTTPLPGVKKLTLAAAAPGQGMRPQNAFGITQFNTPAVTGGSANALVRVWNMDSFGTVSTTLSTTDGIARIALPTGRYFSVAQFVDFDDQGEATGLRYVSSGFTVADGTGTTDVTLDENTATVPSTVDTPKPAEQTHQVVDFGLQDETGAWDVVSTTVDGARGTDLPGEKGTDLYVAPAASGPPAGRLRYTVQWDGIAPSSGADLPYPDESDYAYRYDLAYGWTDEIPSGPYPVRNADLATVRQHVYADPAQSPATIQFSEAPLDPVLPAEAAGSRPGDPLTHTAPGDFTDYVGTADGGEWFFDSITGPGYGMSTVFADPRTYAGGHTYSVDWNRGPLTPQWGQHTPRPDALYQTCQACVTENGTENYMDVFYSTNAEDSQPDATGIRYSMSDAGGCWINGQQTVFWSDCHDDHILTPDDASAGPNTYHLVYDTAPLPGVTQYSQSTSTHTDLTFRFAYKAHPPADMTLPSGYDCDHIDLRTQPRGACEILPVLTLNYALETDEYNTSSAPVEQLKLDVGHLTYDGMGSHAAITSASVDVSFDGGTTWQPAVVGGDNGHYTAHWPNPASARGTSPALRVTATDADGGSITQVVDNAYTVAGKR